MEIYELVTKGEKYSLIDQTVRSSRSVCVCIAESYRKRRYVAHFIAKIMDTDMENCETQTWLEFSFACKYINEETYRNLYYESEEVGKLLEHMINHPGKYGVVM